MSRGRPKINEEKLKEWVLEDKDYTGEITRYYFDEEKNPRGIWKTEIENNKDSFPESINPNPNYINCLTVMVFRTSNRKNAKVKIKTWKNKNIDDVLFNKQSGIPKGAEILEVGVGNNFKEIYKQKYNL